MSIEKITQSEINRTKISSLPTRPNASSAFGGAGYSSLQMKEAFDKLPLLIAQKLNYLIDTLSGEDDCSICSDIKTPIIDIEGNRMSLLQILCDIISGEIASYFHVENGKNLTSALNEKAPILSPSFSGCPMATTPSSVYDDSSRIATTAWVHDVISTLWDVFLQIKAGIYGHIPDGGECGDVLVKASAENRDVTWASLSNFDFDSPTAITQNDDDNSRKVATTQFVKIAIDALKGNVGDAYDTLLEIATALTDNADGISDALTLIASKDNKTTFETFSDNATLTLISHREYRATDMLCSVSLALPQYPDDDYICTLDFCTSDAQDMSYSYAGNPTVYSTGDDCTDGIFIPIRGKHYTWVLWFSGGKYQGVVRRSQ